MILTQNSKPENSELLKPIENNLTDSIGGGEVIWCNSGTTALYVALKIISRRNGFGSTAPEIILPAISCHSPVGSAIMAGWKPRFADIDPETGLTTLEHIKLRWTPLTRAVLFIHLYGHTADLTEIEQWCREKDLVLIEDNAQALGAVCQTDSLWAVLDKCHSIVSILRRLSNAGEELW